MTTLRTPFNRVSVVGRELEYVAEAVASGHISGTGAFTARCERLLEAALGAPAVMLATSCTHALEMAALLLEIEPGDEVIVPSFTFVSTANAFVLRGARPVFADVREDTLNLDESSLEALVTPRTRAIVPVHYAGVACEMDAINAVAARHGLAVVEDNAHGLYGRYRGRALGTLGAMATQSFHDTKNIACGEGGALVLNDPSLVARAHVVREKGTDRHRYYLGQVDKYSWRDLGSSYVISDLLAAFLLGQLESAATIQASRHRAWNAYRDGLADWAAQYAVRLPVVPDHCEHPAHLFYLLLPTAADRAAFLDHMRARGVAATFHYVPLHSSAMGLARGAAPDGCPRSTAAAERLVRLPLFHGMTDDHLGAAIEAVTSFRPA
jgi:dTDP-4-amino-4,6-dideoxygalactose transaminase